MTDWNKAVQRKSGAEKPLLATDPVRPKRQNADMGSSLGAVPKLEDERVRPTQKRGAKADGRMVPRTGRIHQTNIRANKKIVEEFGAEADRLGLTRGAFFEKCYHAFKVQQGDKSQAFLLQALVKLDHIAKFESKARGRVVTPEAVLEDMFVQRAEMLGMQAGNARSAGKGQRCA
jgi:hypothetical protein